MSIWFFALGYFLSYVPYSALVKALSSGKLPGMTAPIDGTVLLPVAALSSMVGMMLFLTTIGWWRYARHVRVAGVPLPCPGRWTFLSGLCTATIVVTTTLAYTFEGVSIVFMMLMLRGGVLIVAPVVDRLSGRKVRWFSWVGLGLSLASLLVAFEGDDLRVSTAAAINVAAYIASYFVRLRFMSHLAKSDDPNASTRYFVEEQMVATPAAVLALAVIAFGPGDSKVGHLLADGFAMLRGHDQLWVLVIVGICSQGTGIFGGLVLLDRRENSFCVPVNRASSMLAGLCAQLTLAALAMGRWPGSKEYVGAALVVAAILVLSLAPRWSTPRTPR
jgi:uncharacterized membrane protein YdcZ (DUF606 family)